MGSGGSGKRARDFSSSYMDVKMGELEFKKQCYADTVSEKKKKKKVNASTLIEEMVSCLN